jgi:hypothetical protein
MPAPHPTWCGVSIMLAQGFVFGKIDPVMRIGYEIKKVKVSPAKIQR